MIGNHNISKLDLRNQKLTTIPKEVFYLKNLRKLDLRNNALKSISQEIKNLKRLEVLDISYNSIEYLYAGLFSLTKLKILLINHNQLKYIPKQIANLTSLKILGLSSNNLRELPIEIENLQALQELTISKNKFDNFPLSILKLINLRYIWLNNNNFLNFPTKDILENLKKLKGIYCYGFSNISSSEYNSHYIKLSKIKGNSIKSLHSLEKKHKTNERNLIKDSSNTSSKTKIFISYSHQDAEWLKRVQVYLKVLNFENDKLEVWDDTKIKSGAKWKEEIIKALKTCRIAILLISMDFLASDFIRSNELPEILKKAEDNDTIVLPFLVRPSRFTKDKYLSIFQSVNEPSKPLSKLTHAEQEDSLLRLIDAVESYL